MFIGFFSSIYITVGQPYQTNHMILTCLELPESGTFMIFRFTHLTKGCNTHVFVQYYAPIIDQYCI